MKTLALVLIGFAAGLWAGVLLMADQTAQAEAAFQACGGGWYQTLGALKLALLRLEAFQ